MSDLFVRTVRGGDTETVHEVAAVVVDHAGAVRCSYGDADLVTPIRSAAKPFQALPLVEDGALEALGIASEELAVACGSHNSEEYQVAVVRGWLGRLGLQEHDLVCGPHRPLAKDLGFPCSDGTWEDVVLAVQSRVASNCSGKHTGMLSLAKFHGWELAGYADADHPVQRNCLSVVSRLCDIDADAVGGAVDGCGVVSWAVPLRALATGYARLAPADGSTQAVVSAMTAHADLVAGKRRLCTALMQAYPGRVLAKVGAGGVYGATVLDEGLGIAVKVLDGDAKAASVALLTVLSDLGLDPQEADTLARFAHPVILNTNFAVVGHYEAVRN